MMQRRIFTLLVLGLLFAGSGIIYTLNAKANDGAVRPFVKGSLAEITQARTGKPYLLVFWSMYCAPCVEEMQTWKSLRENRDDFDIVMVSTDPMEKADTLTDLLDHKGLAGVEKWAFADRMSARVRYDVDPKWRGELPRIHFVTADAQHDPVIGKVGEDRVIAWLDAQKQR